MGRLKHRVDRLYATSGVADRLDDERRHRRQFRERKAVVLYFLRAFPPEMNTPEVGDELGRQLEPWLDDILNRHFWGGEGAPLVARVVARVDSAGWIPSPLPAAWVRAVLDHPAAGKNECGNCGLPHPSGGHTWKDGRPVFAPPHFPHCLHCGEPMGEVSWGVVAPGYYQRHNASHPYPVLGMGKFLLEGGDPNKFDPLRKRDHADGP